MEFLHIIPPFGRVCYELLKSIEMNQLEGQHKALVLVSDKLIHKKNPALLRYSFIEYVNKANGWLGNIRYKSSLKKRLLQADAIFVHGLNYLGMSVLEIIHKNEEILKKIIWVENGLDLKNWSTTGKPREKARQNKIQREVRERIPVMCTHSAANLPTMEELWPGKTYFETPYPMPEGWGEMADANLAHKKEIGVPEDKLRLAIRVDPYERKTALNHTYIMGGLNYRVDNHQNLIFGLLKRFNVYKKTVFMPVAYEIDEILASTNPAEKRLQELKKKPLKGISKQLLRKPVPAETYFRFMKQMDAAMLGNSFAIAPIYPLLLLRSGVKVYMPSKTNEYAFFKEMGAPIYAWEEISEMKYLDFLQLDEDYTFPESLKWYFDREAVAARWNAVVKYVESKE